jgi:hypothetical protein
MSRWWLWSLASRFQRDRLIDVEGNVIRSMRFALMGLALGLLAVACGTSEDTTTTAAAASTSSSAPATTTTVAATTTTVPPETTTSSTLAGAPIDFFPETGDELGVVGVGYNDVLNVRVGPGIFNDIVDTIDPTGSTTATGNARDLGQAIWIEHDTGAAVGWSNYAFLAFLGDTDDVTSQVVDALGEYPTADSMVALGLVVAKSLASEDPPSVIVMTVEPTIGDLGEVTYDVLGLGDDAVYGYRLHIFGEPVTDGFGLRNVESTLLCNRGVSDGLCL